MEISVAINRLVQRNQTIESTGMNCIGRRRMTICLVAAMCATTCARAATTSLPPEQSQGAVIYMSGGIDRDQESAMRRAAVEYSLELEFSWKGELSKVPIAYVPVTIRDQTGKIVLDRASDGPLLLVRLPDGRYTITAQKAGEAEVREVTVVDGHPDKVTFTWAPSDNPMTDSGALFKADRATDARND